MQRAIGERQHKGSYSRSVSNLGKWDRWYAGLTEPQPYGDTPTYEMGAEFLAPCEMVEDWGCGKGWFRRFRRDGYSGVDGSWSPFADVVADLVTYRSSVPGVFMRHVLEHNYDWAAILDNAVASFTERMVLVTFTPFSDRTHEITFAPDPGVPDMSFRLSDLTDRFGDATWRCEELQTATQYGVEAIFFLERAPHDG